MKWQHIPEAIWKVTRWFQKDWWVYLLQSNPESQDHLGWPGWRKLICRTRGHPSGVLFYNPGGSEPDMHCKNCGDYLG